jgi:molybdopterin molybdotransferase
MLSVSDALSVILAQVETLAAETVPLADALGRVLAEEVVADRDSPPFTKALMDGYAVRSADVVTGLAELAVIEEVTAGKVPSRVVGPGEATRIMTGASLPAGADAVVPVEVTTCTPRVEWESGEAGGAGAAGLGVVTIRSKPVQSGQSVLPQGASLRAGNSVLKPGVELGPQHIGALGELGRMAISVIRRPRVAVIATGDELVPVEETPGPGQIRNSNEAMLAAQVARMGAIPVPLGIARDNAADLAAKIQLGLAADVLLLSGGVSAGILDLVPQTLQAAGVRELFHRVRLKPGQPLWYGVRPSTPAQPSCHVFGLPGNPVSSMVCCDLFGRAAIRKLMGQTPAIRPALRARLVHQFTHKGDRPTYHPAIITPSETGYTAQTVRWIGSADLCATVEANGVIAFPAGEYSDSPDTIVETFLW